MVNEEKYLLVAESIAPEIFKKVLEAKKYIATGKGRKLLGGGAAGQHLAQRLL